MRLTTKGRYAVTAMLDLALYGKERPVPLADIAQRQCISLSYLEQLFARLRRQDLVQSAHGPGGGYRLGRAADQISVAEVITAVDERVDTTRCGGHRNCQQGQPCLTHDLWEDMSRQIYEFLDSVDLAQITAHHEVQKVAERQNLQGHNAAGITLQLSSLCKRGA